MSLLRTPSCHLVSRKVHGDPLGYAKDSSRENGWLRENLQFGWEFNALFSHSTNIYGAICQAYASCWDMRINNTQQFMAQWASKHGREAEGIWRPSRRSNGSEFSRLCEFSRMTGMGKAFWNFFSRIPDGTA